MREIVKLSLAVFTLLTSISSLADTRKSCGTIMGVRKGWTLEDSAYDYVQELIQTKRVIVEDQLSSTRLIWCSSNEMEQFLNLDSSESVTRVCGVELEFLHSDKTAATEYAAKLVRTLYNRFPGVRLCPVYAK